MAYAITNYSFPGVAGAKPRITAVLDSAADVEALGGTEKWSPGSLAILAEAGFPTLLLSKSNGWVNGNTGGSGGGSGLPSGSSPNQYLVTDGDGNVKWEDKLCWSEKTEKEVLPETVLSESAGQEGNVYVYMLDCSFEVGKKYTVVYNGVEYDVAPTVINENDGVVGGGNLSLVELGEDTGEPFMISYNPNMGAMVGTLDGGGITIAIYCEDETIHPIDKKYLPTLTVNIDKNGVADKTFDEIMEAEQGGYSVELMETTDDGIKFKYTRIGNEFVCVHLVGSELYIYVCEYSWDNEKWQTNGAQLNIGVS